MISIILFVLAAICNSIMDTLGDHQEISIFSSLQAKYGWFWSNAYTESWKNKYANRDPSKGRVKWNIFGLKINRPVQITDAWHFFKMLMIVLAVFSAVFYIPVFSKWWMDIILFGIVWNSIFALFYNKVLLK